MSDRFVLVLLKLGGWLAALIGLGFAGYAFYAIATGTIELAGRYSQATFVFSRNPGPFLFALSIYLLGFAACAWVAKVLLLDDPKWRRDRAARRK
jgi:H+/Cl- antiporter ClcA